MKRTHHIAMTGMFAMYTNFFHVPISLTRLEAPSIYEENILPRIKGNTPCIINPIIINIPLILSNHVNLRCLM